MTASARGSADVDELVASLEPVRAALVDDATTEAERIIVEATHDADSMIAEAEAQVDAAIRREEKRSEMSARARADRRIAHAHNDTHRDVLRAKAEIRRHLLDAARAAALELRDDPRYPDLLAELERLARDQLGPDPAIERNPPGVGGLIAVDGDHRLDYTLPALADRALDSLADDVAELWR